MGKLYVVCGDDEFAIKERSRTLASELAGGAPEENPAVEIIAGDSDELKPEAVVGRFLDAARTPPFLCSDKLVWLRHFPDFELFSAKSAAPVYQETAALLGQELPPDLTVLLDGFGFDVRKGFGKALKAAGAVIETLNVTKSSDKHYADDRRLNIREICRAAGKSIEPAAAQFLTETLGGDSGTLRNELEKLFSYTGDAPAITLNDCRAVCCRTPETVSWEFTGAIVSRNLPLALQLLNVLLRQGEPEIRLMGSLSGEYQKLIQTKLAMQQLKITRISAQTFYSLPPSLKEEFPNNVLLKLHAYRAYKVCEAAANYTDAELIRNLELVRNANRALVSGGGDRRIILEQLLIKLTRRPQR